MASEAQVRANRENAQKSTGPRTPAGKETACQNALKHGLLAREGAIRGEDPEEFGRHRNELLDQLVPGSPLEEILAARVVDLTWRLKRAAQDQSEAFATLYAQYAAAEEPPGLDADGATRGRMLVADFGTKAVLERLLRYERRIESSLYRTLKELRQVHDRGLQAAQEVIETREQWRKEDGEARKRRAFACYGQAAVSPGPSAGTNPPGAERSSGGAARAGPPTRPASEEPAGNEMNPNDEVAGVAWEPSCRPIPLPTFDFPRPLDVAPPVGIATNGPAADKTCETNPIPAAGPTGLG